MQNALRTVAMAVAGLFANTAYAQISVELGNSWDYIPQVVVHVGYNNNCLNDQVRFNGPLSRGNPNAGSYPEAGVNGANVCWQRTNDPDDAESGLNDPTDCNPLDSVCYVE
jgi:hypothetical protein